jgi:aminomethyltransferase
MVQAAEDVQSRENAGDLRAEFRELVSGCGLYRIDRALLSLTGEDRVRWLNGMVTNNIRDLTAGNGVYAFLLNPQGKIQADLYAFNLGDRLLIETGASQIPTVRQIFDRYIIMDDVEVEDLSEKFAVIGVAGPKSESTLNASLTASDSTHSSLKPLQFAELTWNGIQLRLIRGDNPAVPTYEIHLQSEDAQAVWAELLKAGAAEIHDDALESFRIASGIPTFGKDIRERDLPQETRQERALHFTKGCYIGQEIVERVRSRGAVHRGLVGFEITGEISPGTKIQSDGKDVGEITSVATVPADTGTRVVGLGYLRNEFMSSEKELRGGDATLKVSALPFTGLF